MKIAYQREEMIELVRTFPNGGRQERTIRRIPEEKITFEIPDGLAPAEAELLAFTLFASCPDLYQYPEGIEEVRRPDGVLEKSIWRKSRREVRAFMGLDNGKESRPSKA